MNQKADKIGTGPASVNLLFWTHVVPGPAKAGAFFWPRARGDR